MKKYLVYVEWSSYSRGSSVYAVDAENEEEAREFYYKGDETSKNTIISGREGDVIEVHEI